MFWNLNNFSIDQIALIDADNNKVLSYKELKDKSEFIALKIAGTKKQLVFLYADNSYQSIISYLAILRSGNACFLIDNSLSYELKVNLVELYNPEIIISSSQIFHHNYNEFIFENNINIYSNYDNVSDNHIINRDLALLLSTSGSTGSPKLVKLSYKNLQSNAESIAQYLNITETEKPITSLPISYSYGLSVVNSHLLKGAAIVLTNESIVFRDFWNIFNSNNCTSFAGVPYSYQLLDKINFPKLELPTLKTMTQAGGRLSDDLQRKYYKLALSRGIQFIVMYGQTEATARMSYLPMNEMGNKIGSIGYPIPGGKFRIISNDNDVTEEGLEGEIVYEGENVMLGYAENRLDLSKGDENKGILFTGDIGMRDSDGCFYVNGRLNRFIKIRGIRCSLDEIEKRVENTFGIPVICYGEDDNLNIAVKSGDVTLLAKIKNEVSKLYKLHNSTLNVTLTSSFPYNKYGKPDYKRLEVKFTRRLIGRE